MYSTGNNQLTDPPPPPPGKNIVHLQAINLPSAKILLF